MCVIFYLINLLIAVSNFSLIKLILSMVMKKFPLFGTLVNTVLSSTASAFSPQYPDGHEKERSIYPLLDVEKPTCNCSNFPMTGKVIVDVTDFFVPETQLPDEDSDDELLNELDEVLNKNVSETEEHVHEQQETDEEQFSEVMVFKGSSFHKHFQGALRSCKQLMLSGTAPRLCLSQEPMNTKDENAIVVKALLHGIMDTYWVYWLKTRLGERVLKFLFASPF